MAWKKKVHLNPIYLDIYSVSTFKDREGRFILIKEKVDGNVFIFSNVNIPSGSESDFYIQIMDRIATEAQGALV